MPLTNRCFAELLKWRKQLGPEFSDYLFANPRNPKTHLKSVRKAWPSTLKERQKGNANCATLAVARKLVAYLMAVDRGQTHLLLIDQETRTAA